MNRQEFSRLADAMRSYYPKETIMPTKESMNLWYEELKDLDFCMAAAALRKHVHENKWSPSIAEIRAQVVEIQAEKTDWGDGWQEVLSAVRRFGIYDEEGALNSMSGMTREVVKRLGWKQICMTEQDELMSVRANFRMIFEEKSTKEKKSAALPVDLKEKIDAITNKWNELLEGGTE